MFLKPLVSGLPVDVLKQVDGLSGQEIFFIIKVHLVRGASPHVSPTFGRLLMIHSVTMPVFGVTKCKMLELPVQISRVGSKEGNW